MDDATGQTNLSKMSISKAGTRVILSPRDSLTYKNCEELERAYNDIIKQNKTAVILDCKAVAFLDSKCLELLLKMHDELENRGGSLNLAGMNAVCRDILITTRLINVFNVYRDVQEALRREP